MRLRHMVAKCFHLIHCLIAYFKSLCQGENQMRTPTTQLFLQFCTPFLSQGAYQLEIQAPCDKKGLVYEVRLLAVPSCSVNYFAVSLAQKISQVCNMAPPKCNFTFASKAFTSDVSKSFEQIPFCFKQSENHSSNTQHKPQYSGQYLTQGFKITCHKLKVWSQGHIVTAHGMQVTKPTFMLKVSTVSSMGSCTEQHL